ncbi:hypothetical protein PGB90_003032 [Kerria lacca]
MSVATNIRKVSSRDTSETSRQSIIQIHTIKMCKIRRPKILTSRNSHFKFRQKELI